tara:strand:- start:485 stop:697 length:213 start_codon:yes stop_codon:yes gene_type:complete
MMNIGDLVKIISSDDPAIDAQNVGCLALVTYLINEHEVEVSIFHSDGEEEPWIYDHEHLEVVNGTQNNTQ